MKRTHVAAAVAALILSSLALIVLPAGARPDKTPAPAPAPAVQATPAASASPAASAAPAASPAPDALAATPRPGAQPKRYPYAPNFTLDDQNGHAVSLADFQGKIVVLEWTNYECPFVKHLAAAGTMRGLAEKYRDKGVVWLAINSTSYATRERDRDWIAQNKLPYPILEDFEGSVGHSFGARTTPHMFVINQKGQIVYEGAIDDDRRITGKPAVNYVDQAVGELIAGQPVTVENTQPYGCSVKYRDAQGAPASAPSASAPASSGTQ